MAFDHGTGAYSGRPGEREPRALSPQSLEAKELSIRDQVFGAIQHGIKESGVTTPYNIVEDTDLLPVYFSTYRASELFTVDGEMVTPSVILVSGPYGRTQHTPGAFIRSAPFSQEVKITSSLTYSDSARLQVAHDSHNKLVLLQEMENGDLGSIIYPDQQAILLLVNIDARSFNTVAVGVTLPEGYEKAFNRHGKLHKTIGEALGTESDPVAEAKRRADEARIHYRAYVSGQISRTIFRAATGVDVDEYRDSMWAEDIRRGQGLEIGEQEQTEGSIYSPGETEVGPLRLSLLEAVDQNKITKAQYYEAGTNPEKIRALLSSLESPAAKIQPEADMAVYQRYAEGELTGSQFYTVTGIPVWKYEKRFADSAARESVGTTGSTREEETQVSDQGEGAEPSAEAEEKVFDKDDLEKRIRESARKYARLFGKNKGSYGKSSGGQRGGSSSSYRDDRSRTEIYASPRYFTYAPLDEVVPVPRGEKRARWEEEGKHTERSKYRRHRGKKKKSK